MKSKPVPPVDASTPLPDPSSHMPKDRLGHLLTSISSLLSCISSLPNASPDYIASLRIFRQRVTTLLGVLGKMEGKGERREEEEDIRMLESEWWNSEVAAAWYGPKATMALVKVDTRISKGIGTVMASPTRQRQLPLMTYANEPKRDVGFVGLNDE